MKSFAIGETVGNPEFKEIHLNVSKCKKPKMSDHRGRTWDTGKLIINEKETKVWLDTTWGEYIYFQIESNWYKVRMFSCTPWNKASEYDLDPFAINPCKISVIIKNS